MPVGDALWHAKTAMIDFREPTVHYVDKKSQEGSLFTAYSASGFIRKTSSCHPLASYYRCL